MAILLRGKIKQEGCGVAGRRLKECAAILVKHGITFPPLFIGTINVGLDRPFPTPDSPNVIYISQAEIDSVGPGYCEWWKFIPVKNINGTGIGGYIFRNTQHVHGDSGAELITVDLRQNADFKLIPGYPMAFEVAG